MTIAMPPEEHLRNLMRAGMPFAEWRSHYDAALAEAFRQANLIGVANLVAVLALMLDRLGRVHEVVEHIRYAERLANGDAAALTLLASIRASYSVTNLDFPAARSALDEAARWREATTSERAIAEYVGSGSVASCVMLQPDAEERMAAAITFLAATPYNGLLMLVQSWLVPRLFAGGQRAAALPHIDALRATAYGIGQRWRMTDADFFELASTFPATADARAAGPPAFAEATNRFAAWRGGLLALYWCDLLGDDAQAREVERRLDGLCEAGLVDPGLAEGWDAARGVVDAVTLDGRFHPPTPRDIGLGNLPVTLAGMYAVALSGTQQAAAEWLRWSDAHLPAWCRTDIAWPASLDRIRGLLAVRAGDARRGLHSLRRGMEWARAAGYHIEADLCALQLADLTERTDHRASDRRLRELRSGVRERLEAAGIPWIRHSYIAAQAATVRERSGLGSETLSARESEVIASAADGLTNGEIGFRLNLSDRTVQTYMRRIFDKLGVRNRVAAIAAARDLGIIE